jgi:uncharacterized RDD family membrane protein YckC
MMEGQETGGSGGARAKYVWDRDKLSWVEARTEAQPAETTAETAFEAPYEAVAEAPMPVAAVTAEEGELQLRGAWIRFVGFILDMIVLMLLQSIVQAIFGSDSLGASFLIPIIGFAYFVGFWTLRGQTLGKMAIGAKVVRLDGSPPGFAKSFVRYIGYMVYFFALAMSARATVWLAVVIGVVVFSVVALSRSKRGLHDLIAGTMVINSRPKLMEDYAEESWEAPEAEADALELEDK